MARLFLLLLLLSGALTERDCPHDPGQPAVMTLHLDGVSHELSFDYCDDLREKASGFLSTYPLVQGAGCPPHARTCMEDELVSTMTQALAEQLCADVPTPKGSDCVARAVALHRQTRPKLQPVTRAEMRHAGATSATDKIRHHGYHRFYWRYLPAARRGVRIFEIGVGREGGSVSMWRKLYPEATIVVLEHPTGIGERFTTSDPRVVVVRGDQADAATLRECAEHGPFDLIVDDGSHFPEHQMLAFETLFAAVKPGGVFIIEDIETSYWPVGHQLYGNYMTGETNVVESFKRIADRVNHEFTGHDYPAVAADVDSVTFAQNCVIVTKHDTPHASEASYDDRPYRFANTPGHVFPDAEAAIERQKAPPT